MVVGLSACSPKSLSGKSGPFSACEQVPDLTPIAIHNCPGANGTWNNYEVKKDSNGTVISVEVWCGGSDQDHPSSQAEYDANIVPASNVSNNDYKSGSNCVSASNAIVSETILNIWQKP